MGEGTPLQHGSGGEPRASDMCVWFLVAEDEARTRARQEGLENRPGGCLGKSGIGWGSDYMCQGIQWHLVRPGGCMALGGGAEIQREVWHSDVRVGMAPGPCTGAEGSTVAPS